MTQFLPEPLLSFFVAREPIKYLPPPRNGKATMGYTGVGDYLKYLETEPSPVPPKYLSREERRAQKRAEKQELQAYKLEQAIAVRKPIAGDKVTRDPYKTLFVGRLNYETTESKLKREFESFGPVKKVILVTDTKTSKPKGYAFIEFEHEKHMHHAYKATDGLRINGRRIVVDYEKGRLDKAWLPRRLGGGLGGTRRGGVKMNWKISGRARSSSPREAVAERSDRRSPRSHTKDRDRDSDIRRARPRRSSSREPIRSRDGEDRRGRRSADRLARVPRNFSLESNGLDIHKCPRRRDEGEHRKRDKSPEKKRRRSRSKEKAKKSDRKDKDKDKDRKHRDRHHGRSEKHRTGKEETGAPGVRIKEEPKDDYPGFSHEEPHSTGIDLAYVKQEFDGDQGIAVKYQ